MDTSFSVVLNIKTITGYETFGRYDLGTDRQFADYVFNMLKGEKDCDETSVLHVDMVETHNGLPLNLKMLSCTLDELA